MGHLSALMKKNALLWKRGGIMSLIEICLPALFCCLFFVFRSSAEVNDINERSYLKPIVEDPKNVIEMPYRMFSDNTYDETVHKYVVKDKNNKEITIYQTPMMKKCIPEPGQDPDKNGHIAMAPKNAITEKLAQYFKANFDYETKFYKDQTEIFDIQTADDYKEDMCLGITFQENGESNKWKYSLHFNTTDTSDNEEIPDTKSTFMNYYKQQNIEEFIDKWAETGFVTIQNWIDNLILKSLTDQQSEIVPFVTSARVPKHKDDELPKLLKGNLGTYMSLPIVIVFLRFLYQLIDEKEKKIREAMKIMGLSDTSFYMSWILQYSIIFMLITILVTILVYVAIFPNSSISLVFVWYLLFNMNIMAQALLIQSFFSKTKMGIIFGMIFYIVLYMVGIIIGESEDYSMGSRTAFSILPQANLSLSGDVFMMVETIQQGITWDKLDLVVEKFTVGRSLLLFIISFIITSLLAIYFDQIIPGEYGAKKHPLFIFPCLLKKRKKSQDHLNNKKTGVQSQKKNQLKDVVEQVEQRLVEQEQSGQALKIRGLSKVYGNGKKAVNDLNLTMYKDQISCLLGHNGAGKTTTISMLVGMIDITEGEAGVFGYDMRLQMQELRKELGLCPQHDILFPNLTVREHLELFAQFKGMTDNEKINREIEQLLVDVDLKFKEHEYTKNLSGGQKRRVSIAIAFIGGSKLVFLDEPTSGCDTSVRRKLWDMLRKYKNDKIIVLTTHFMDEADYLGDRISIMGEGHLICSGSPVYLKNKFGVGYNLTLVKQDTTSPSQPIIDVVMKHIESANKVSDVSAELAFQLDISTVDLFQSLFNELDEKKSQLQISNYGISITTIEEVFLKVAHSNAKNEKMLKSTLSRQMSKDLDKEIEKEKVEEAIDNFDLNSVRLKDPLDVFLTHFWALVQKRTHYFKRDSRGLICEMILPCIMLILGLWSLTITASGNSPSLALDGSIFYDEYDVKSPVLYGGQNSVNKEQLKDVIKGFDEQYYEFNLSEKQTLEEFDLDHFENREEKRKGGYFFNQLSQGTSNNVFKAEYMMFAESLNKDVVPLFVNEMNEALIRKATSNSNFELDCVIHPFKETKKSESQEGTNKGIQAAFIFSIVLSFIPASVVVFIVKEREDQVKHQQSVSGVSLPAYWLSNYFVDLTKYLFPVAVIAISMLYAYDLNYFIDDSSVSLAVILLILFYGTAVIPFTYLTGFMFRSYGNAQVMTFFMHFLLGGLAPMILFLMRTSIDSAKDIIIIIGYFLKFIPSFAFGNGIILLASRENLVHIDDDLDEIPHAFDMNIAGADVYFLAAFTIIHTLLIFFIENLKNRGALDRVSGSGSPEYIPKIMDDDVSQEIMQVEKSQLDDYVVRVDKIRKVFKMGKNKYNQAVDRVSFGIKNGECFTLLGVNGAGKTTIFKMLSGDIQPTLGSAHIKGYNVKTQMGQARFHIGYCPQFDALLDNLTTREHLELYSSIKGIPKHLRKDLIDKKIKEMELSKFENVCAGTYSGGNKRKLSVAIAMMGNPPIVFLDEPSTGMDPVARRYMWNVISRITTLRKSSSVILTTHSMEEAEALSTKLAIQVAGQLKCIGNITHIKEKFGGGYEVEVKVEQVEDQILQGMAGKSGKNLEDKVQSSQLENVLEKIGYGQKMCLVGKGQIGEELYTKMLEGKLKLGELIEFFLLEDNFQKIKNFVGQTFGQFSVIEHFSTFSRFKIETDIPTGKIFGSFEQAKKELNIASYSVKQATIESIFNQFANGMINTVDFNKGGSKYKENLGQKKEVSREYIEETEKNVNNNNNDLKSNVILQPQSSSGGFVDARQIQIGNVQE